MLKLLEQSIDGLFSSLLPSSRLAFLLFLV